MLAQREVEASEAAEDGLGVGEFAEAPLAVIGAHAGVAGAVEGNALHHHVDADFVDAAAAVLLGAHDATGPSDVLGEQVHGQGVFPVGDGFHERIDLSVLERDDGQKRAEKFVLDDVLVNTHGIDDRGSVTAAFTVARAAA